MFPLEFKRVYQTLPEKGWLYQEEAKLLWDSANMTEGPILEVGCYFGRSSVLLASLGRTLYCVDPFDNFDSDLSGDEVENGFIENMKSRDLSFELHRCKIEDWKTRPVGFAYLDGDHTYEGTMAQIQAAKNCGAKLVCLHDWAEAGGGIHIARAVEDSNLVIRRRANRMVRCNL